MNLLFISLVFACTEAHKRRSGKLKSAELYTKTDSANPGQPLSSYLNPPNENIVQIGNNSDSDTLWFDLPSILIKNVESPRKHRKNTKESNLDKVPWFSENETEITIPQKTGLSTDDFQFFLDNTFELGKRKSDINWTTCDEFGHGASFRLRKVVDIDWLPFYIWISAEIDAAPAVVHRFSLPTPKELKELHLKLGQRLSSAINWNQTKLFLQSDEKYLLIAGDRTGLFHSLPLALPQEILDCDEQLGTFLIRIKLVGRYLAMMSCEEPHAAVMAVAGQEPPTDREKTLEAETIRFRGTGRPAERDAEEMRKAELNKRDINGEFD